MLVSYLGGAIVLDAFHHHADAPSPGGGVSITPRTCGDASTFATGDLTGRCPACTHAGFTTTLLPPPTVDRSDGLPSPLHPAPAPGEAAQRPLLRKSERSPPTA